MNNSFTKHNIDHLSASTINLWISSPAMCLMKLAGYSSQAGPAAWRGIGADRAISALVANKKMSLESANNIGETEFTACEAGSGSAFAEEKILKERKHMLSCIKVGYDQFVQTYRSKTLESTQGKIEVMLEDVAVPFIGYYDLLFSDVVVDLKTKSYALSKPTLNDCRQMSLYAHATGKVPWLAYITHKEVRQFRVDEHEKYLHDVRNAALSLEKILSFSDDIEECCRLVYPDLDHWMWSDEDKIIAKRIWRMK